MAEDRHDPHRPDRRLLLHRIGGRRSSDYNGMAKDGRPTKVLRQPHERPPSVAIPKESAGSWWVGLTREQLAARIAERAQEMRNSPIARILDGVPRR